MRAALPSLLVLLLAAPAHGFWDPVTARCDAPPLFGTGRAIDGDTLELLSGTGHRTVVRLIALEAPELFQSCRDAEGEWPCGFAARDRLEELLAGRALVCTPCGSEPDGTTGALCRDGETDLGVEMVASGLATSHAFFSNAMQSAEALARRAGRGLWRGDWVHPRAWRDGRRLGEGRCQGCLLPP